MGTSGDKIVLLDGIGGSDSYNAMVSMIPGLLANVLGGSKMDPNLVAALMNGRDNKDQFGGSGAWFMWIIILFWLFGNRGFGNFGGGNPLLNGLPNQINNDYGFQMLMQATQGNRDAVERIASNLGVSTTQLQNAIFAVQSAIDKVSGQAGLNTQSVINAIQSNGCEIGNLLAQCCCDMKSLVNQSTCSTQNMITQQGYQTQLRTVEQTGVLQNAMNNGFLGARDLSTAQFNALNAKLDAQNVMISDKFCELEKREMQHTIDTLREEKNALQSSALLQQQSQNLINQLRPTAVPAYPSCSPYQAYNWGQVFGNSCGNCCNPCCGTSCCTA